MNGEINQEGSHRYQEGKQNYVKELKKQKKPKGGKSVNKC